MSKRTPHLIVEIRSRPVTSAGLAAPTHLKDWAAKTGGKWEVEETVHFYDRVPTKFWTKAYVIIDIMNAKVLKNRFSVDGWEDDDVFKHYIEKYQSKVESAIAAYLLRVMPEGIDNNEVSTD